MTKEPPKIVFLDDSEDLRELMPALLEPALGVECMCFASLMELENHSTEVLRARVAILDVNLGPDAPDGVDAFNWLMDHGFHGESCNDRADNDYAPPVHQGRVTFRC